MRADELFELLASTTWRTILRANRNRISFGEDAITSINLNAIASLPGSVVVEDARADEAHKGCDFEMWTGSDHKGWYRYAVQAKKVSFNGWRYEKLKHVVRGRDQIDVLKDYAATVRAAPIYCFYNFAPHVLTFNCKRDKDATQLGCMVVPVGVVEDAIRMRGCRHFGWLHMQPEAIPWRCLITCPPLHGQHASAYAPFRWPTRESFYHDRLPEALRATADLAPGIEMAERSGRDEQQPYSREDESFYPRWRVVVDTGEAPLWGDGPDDRRELPPRLRLG
ncbi:DUF6615 family protein [Peristeroidobacter soli]|uniref:DUF6615 family protein n=1 Tax=Peristeroidobacter soli TaxID=2497877 RepID=UPI00101D9B5B|nr:DUF6615 family protein [Peristeroidobacter soli]